MITALIFLIALIAYYTIGLRYQSIILTALSLYVYWQVAEWGIIVVGGIALMVLIFSRLLEDQKNKLYVIVPILCIILSFVFLREIFAGWVLPLGFSVLSFTSICLLVDQYHSPKKYKAFDVLSYLLFFSKIFAGPIERASHFIVKAPIKFSGMGFYTGLKYLIFATFVKYIMGDWFGRSDMSAYGINQVVNVLVFALGFFFDFWGYTLMAIGVGKLFGYNLSASFNRPYASRTLREFWHRWNITLGTWLRDYIYIPLGGNRNSTFKWVFVVLIVFLLSGLWHGATIPFILWGLCHGVLLCVERLIFRPERYDWYGITAYRIIVMVVVALLWQLFLVNSVGDIITLIDSMFIYEPLVPKFLYHLAISMIGMFLLTSEKAMSILNGKQLATKAVVVEVSVLSFMLVALLLLNCPMSFNFFYFRF